MNDLRCPLCGLPLLKNPQGLACDKRHQFDRAREGYFNLLPVQQKHSREPGDAKEQLQARRRFLEAGFFAPFAQRLQALIPKSTKTLLDIGCGEGYFTRAMADVLAEDAQVYGVDIAKAGVRLAAKSAVRSNTYFTVASNFDLPLADASMDVITRICAPSKDAELRRAIKPNGVLLIAAPAANHLLGLRRRIYNDVRAHEPPPVPDGFEIVAEDRVTSELIISEPPLVKALVAMTPFAWRISEPLSRDLEEEGLSDQLDFGIYTYQPLPT